MKHQQVNLETFNSTLAVEYARLFAEDLDYAYAAARTTPSAMARKITLGLDNGSANKDGTGIRRTCAKLGIPHNYKAIRAYLAAA